MKFLFAPRDSAITAMAWSMVPFLTNTSRLASKQSLHNKCGHCGSMVVEGFLTHYHKDAVQTYLNIVARPFPDVVAFSMDRRHSAFNPLLYQTLKSKGFFGALTIKVTPSVMSSSEGHHRLRPLGEPQLWWPGVIILSDHYSKSDSMLQ